MPFVEVPALAGDAEAGEVALAFMSWLQRGVGDGSIKYNEAGAMVHFVAHGMLLVSPRIFREFAALSLAGDEAEAPQVREREGRRFSARCCVPAGIWSAPGGPISTPSRCSSAAAFAPESSLRW